MCRDLIYDLRWELGEHLESVSLIDRDVKGTILLCLQTIAIVLCVPPLSCVLMFIECAGKGNSAETAPFVQRQADYSLDLSFTPQLSVV